MSNQCYSKIVYFHIATNALKKMYIFVFDHKITYQIKTLSLSLKSFGRKEIVLFIFQKLFWVNKKLCFVLDICELNPNIFVLFLD